MISSAEPPETATAVCCPGCGYTPPVGALYCRDCYNPVDDCSDLERIHGLTVAGWNANVQLYLDGCLSEHIRAHVARCDAQVDAGAGGREARALGRLLRDELTRRHNECLDPIPPPPSVPREERDTVRPGVAS